MQKLDIEPYGELSWEEIRGFLLSIMVKSSHERARRWASGKSDEEKKGLEHFKGLMMSGGVAGGGCSA